MSNYNQPNQQADNTSNVYYYSRNISTLWCARLHIAKYWLIDWNTYQESLSKWVNSGYMYLAFDWIKENLQDSMVLCMIKIGMGEEFTHRVEIFRENGLELRFWIVLNVGKYTI